MIIRWPAHSSFEKGGLDAAHKKLLRGGIIFLSFIFLFACNPQPDSSKPSTVLADSLASRLKLQPGFKAEHLYCPSDHGNGSWVSMTFDNKGRLIGSDQYGALYRMQMPQLGSSDTPSVERLPFDISNADGMDSMKGKLQMGYAQGLLWAFNSLYVVVNHKGDSIFPKTSGLYRLQDTNNDDQFDKVTLLKTIVGEEEHGPHSVKLSPDGKYLYVVAGNHTTIPQGINNYTLPPVWQRDNILPDRFELDPRTAAAAGWVAKVDSSGKNWEIVCAGLRNTFDIAFNEAGDLFGYDSDMEWDLGMPWYRPTRICHLTSGGEFGWRDADGKWSPDYIDNLPPLLNIGQGSPTNVVSVKDARFPSQYKNTILAFDWSFGIIYAIHLTPDGSSYRAKGEEFISGAPLPLTDGVIGPDGALYFLTGGRRLESHLYRVHYEDGKQPVVSSGDDQPKLTAENQLRRQLEQFHGPANPAALDIAWPQLKSKDRFIRYAARIAVEHQPVSQWQDRALKEKDPVTLMNAMVALARHGSKSLEPAMIGALQPIDLNILSKPQQLDLLRVYELIFARMGVPRASQTSALITKLTPHYPAATNDMNRALSKVLVFLNDPSVVEKTLSLINAAKDDSTDQPTFAKAADLILRNPQYGMDLAGAESATPPAQQIFDAVVLSEIKTGWTPELREKYFKWFHNAYSFRGGRFYVGYIDAARGAALSSIPSNQHKHYDTLSTNKASKNEVIDWVKIMSDGGPGRQWKLQAALDTVNTLANRDFKQAKAMFTAAACINCHAIRGEGGSVGPDLTQLGTRFSKKDILESIIEPSKTISDQYASTVLVLKDGSSVMGKLVKQDGGKYYLSQNPFSPQTLREVDEKLVVDKKLANVSMMPPLLINQLNPERLRDLMAYLVSGGNPQHPVFDQSKSPNKK